MKKNNKITFTQRVYRLVKKIPKGYVSTYGGVAKALHSRAYRAIGNVMNKNPHAPTVPCHRVISSDGRIGGFASGTKNKIRMLKAEGIEIKNNRIDLEKYFYKLR